MKYIYDLQTCIVPHYCVLSGWILPNVSLAQQTETQQGRLCGADAHGMVSLQYRDEPYLPCLLFNALMSTIP